MNAIPLINNAPRPNINVGSIGSPTFNPVAAGAKLGGSIGGNVMRQNPASMPVNNETQLRQEVNTSIVALKREAFSLENLIAQAAQTLQDINKRLSELEGKQGDYVKKADATVASVGGNGKYISAISETDGKINATATDLGNMVPVNSVTSGNLHSVTSGAVYDALIALKTVSRGFNLLSANAQLTSNGLTYTITEKGIVKVNFCKIGQGYSLFLSRNDTEQDRFSFYQGNSGYNFGSLSCFVDVGDTIKIYSDGSYTDFYIQVIIMQKLGIR